MPSGFMSADLPDYDSGSEDVDCFGNSQLRFSTIAEKYELVFMGSSC